MANQDFGKLNYSTDPTAPTVPAPQQAATTWPADNSDLDRGRIIPNGVGITEGERDAIDAIGERHDMTRNALIRYAVRRFLVDYRAGKIDLAAVPEKPKRPKRMPKRQLVLPR